MVAVALAAWRIRVAGLPGRMFWVVLAIAVASGRPPGFNASIFREPTSGRYQYMGAIFVVLIAAELLRGACDPAPGGDRGAVAVAALAALSNVPELHTAYKGLTGFGRLQPADLAALELTRDVVDPGFALTEQNSGVDYLGFVDAGSYLSAVDAFGSPAYTPEELRRARGRRAPPTRSSSGARARARRSAENRCICARRRPPASGRAAAGGAILASIESGTEVRRAATRPTASRSRSAVSRQARARCCDPRGPLRRALGARPRVRRRSVDMREPYDERTARRLSPALAAVRRRPRRGRGADLAHAVATRLLLDEWDLLLRRRGSDAFLLEPHNEHIAIARRPSTGPCRRFGMDSPRPFQVVSRSHFLRRGGAPLRLASTPRRRLAGTRRAAAALVFGPANET